MQTFTKVFLGIFTLLILIQLKVLAQGDTAYTVRIGTFSGAQHLDFQALHEIGFVYDDLQANSYQHISVGTYSNKGEATTTLGKVKQRGYPDAYVQPIPLAGSPRSIFIQLALLTAGKKVDWTPYFQTGYTIFASQNGSELRILAGGFDSDAAMKQALTNVKNAAFPQAFPKSFPTAIVHQVESFESGWSKDMKPKDNSMSAKGAEPAKEAAATSVADAPNSPPGVKFSYPEIQPSIKRTAALELQTILKAQGAYAGSLDGYYGEGTRKGYELFTSSNRQWKKYLLLGNSWLLPTFEESKNLLQNAINGLQTNPKEAMEVLKSSDKPLAQAYLAYGIFSSSGPSPEVNRLMNSAIKNAFSGQGVAKPSFDYNATYAYSGFDQLINHLSQIHKAFPTEYAVPCWLFEKHPSEAKGTFTAANASAFHFQDCDYFSQWPEVQILQRIAYDLSIQPDETILKKDADLRTALFLDPVPLNDAERNNAFNWHDNLWKSMDGWAQLDPFHKDLVATLKVAYFQSQLRIEAYYISQNIRPEDAKYLALETLKTLVGEYLARFTS